MIKTSISVIIPSYEEGNSIKTFLNDLVHVLESLGKTWEIIFLDNNTPNNSEGVLKDFSSKYDNFHAFQIKHPGVRVKDKANKYMLGFELAKGDYIFHMDADGQDRPEELPKFIQKLDEGYDLVVGYKKRRKDNFLYTFTSRALNFVVRFITGAKVHDMNNGFKGYRKSVAKTLKLYGGDFRFIPIILSSRKARITEVEVEHRSRSYGEGKFSFGSRLRGGIIDLLAVLFSTKLRSLHKRLYSNLPDSYKGLILKVYG